MSGILNQSSLGKFCKRVIDSEQVVGIKRLHLIRQKYVGKKIIFATGCFDIIHSGHSIFFEQLRQIAGEKGLVVIGLGRDTTIAKLKRDPINCENNRAYSLAAQREVDIVVLNDKKIGKGKVDFLRVMEILRPDIFVLNDDDSAIEIKRALCLELKVDFITVPRVIPTFLQMTSTTDIMNKIRSS